MQQCPQGHEDNAATLNDLVQSVRFSGASAPSGSNVPRPPAGPASCPGKGKARFVVGDFCFKGQHMGTGRARSSATNRHLRSLIAQDKVKPSWIVSHDLPLDQAPEACKHFDAREEGWAKVVLHPGQAA